MRVAPVKPLLLSSVAAVLVALSVTPGWAAADDKDLVRQSLLDRCVYQRFQKESQRDSAVDVCKCAAKKAISDMDETLVADYRRRDRMSRRHQGIWSDALKACL